VKRAPVAFVVVAAAVPLSLAAEVRLVRAKLLIRADLYKYTITAEYKKCKVK